MPDQDIIDRPKTVTTPKTTEKVKPKKPPLYKVILVNDDYTPFDMVVEICAHVFKMGKERAFFIMLTAHTKGSCIIACYTKDVAETKSQEAMKIARDWGFPLRLEVEPEGNGKDDGNGES